MKKLGWLIFGFLAIMIGLYPAIYFFIDERFGLLSTKPDALLQNPVWNAGFYTHITLGGVALLIGWTQFSKSLRKNYIRLHRRIGLAYIICVVLSAVAALYISFYATAGPIAATGFAGLGITWLTTTLVAYIKIRSRDIDAHERMMVFSYAACFAAVTLRIWLPLLGILFGEFNTAYRIVAWLCWVPNILVAAWIVRRMDRQKLAGI
jgi:hypothetical protein